MVYTAGTHDWSAGMERLIPLAEVGDGCQDQSRDELAEGDEQ